MMAEFLEAKYEDAVEAILHLISRNAEITSERERARQTAVLLEQALSEAEGDLEQALEHIEKLSAPEQEIENWKRLYDIVEEEKHELREQARLWQVRAENAEEDRRALEEGSVVEFAHELTADHVGALVRIEISDEVVVEDRITHLEFRDDFGSLVVGVRLAKVQKGFEVKGGASVKVLDPSTLYVEVPF